MRIGIDIRAIGQQRTGDETYVLELVKNLVKIDFINEYFLYTDATKKKKILQIKKILNIKNNNLQVISVKPVSKLLWTFWSLTRQAQKDKLDILHIQYIAPLFLTRKIKLIITIHDISFARYPGFIKWKDLLLLKFFIRPSLKKATRIVAVSNFTKKEINDVYGIALKKINTIYNGGVSKYFLKNISRTKLLSFQEKYDIMKPYLLYLGTLQPRKNISFLLKVFVALKNKYKNDDLIRGLNLVIRGTRWGYNYDKRIDYILDKIKKENKNIFQQIKFVDYLNVKDIPFLFAGANIFCFPSLYEGFGLPLLESMAVGTPVVASKNSCFSEITAGATLLADSNSQKHWVEQIYKLLKNKKLQNKLIQKGLKRAEYFSWRKNAQQTLNLYDNLNK
jgi:glycosyltransferase involved in cell wall biosynthesis